MIFTIISCFAPECKACLPGVQNPRVDGRPAGDRLERKETSGEGTRRVLRKEGLPTALSIGFYCGKMGKRLMRKRWPYGKLFL